MNSICLSWTLSFISSILLLSIVLSPIAGATSLNIFPPESKPYGLTYTEHIENYWKWALGIPAEENPLNDKTGDKTGEICARGQSNSNSSVFYLTFNNGGLSERVCKVPAGMGLFIPVIQALISNIDLKSATPSELKEGVKKDQDSVNSLYLKIGDKEYNYDELKEKYRNPTDIFNVTIAPYGIFGAVEGGPTKAAADGYYVITEPLQKGNYTVHYKSSLLCIGEGCAETNFAQDIKYTIIAE